MCFSLAFTKRNLCFKFSINSATEPSLFSTRTCYQKLEELKLHENALVGVRQYWALLFISVKTTPETKIMTPFGPFRLLWCSDGLSEWSSKGRTALEPEALGFASKIRTWQLNLLAHTSSAVYYFNLINSKNTNSLSFRLRISFCTQRFWKCTWTQWWH